MNPNLIQIYLFAKSKKTVYFNRYFNNFQLIGRSPVGFKCWFHMLSNLTT